MITTKQLAKENSIKIIEYNIKDWDIEIHYLKNKIEVIENALKNARFRRNRWKEASKIKNEPTKDNKTA